MLRLAVVAGVWAVPSYAQSGEFVTRAYFTPGDTWDCTGDPPILAEEVDYAGGCGWAGAPCAVRFADINAVRQVCNRCARLVLMQNRTDNVNCFADVCPTYQATILVQIRETDTSGKTEDYAAWTLSQQGWHQLCPWTCEQSNPNNPATYPDCVQSADSSCRYQAVADYIDGAGTEINVSGSFQVAELKVTGWAEADCETGEYVWNGFTGGFPTGTLPTAPPTTTTTTVEPTTVTEVTEPPATTPAPETTQDTDSAWSVLPSRWAAFATVLVVAAH